MVPGIEDTHTLHLRQGGCLKQNGRAIARPFFMAGNQTSLRRLHTILADLNAQGSQRSAFFAPGCDIDGFAGL